MKIKIFIFLIMAQITCFGQGLNGEVGFNDDFLQHSIGIAAVGEYSYIVKSQSTSSIFTSCSLVKIDTLENIVWSSSIQPQFAETMEVFELIPSEDGGVYLLGFGMQICDVGGNCFWFVQRYNPDGGVVWTKIWPDQNSFIVELSGLTLSNRNELLVGYYDANKSNIYKLDAAGIVIDSLLVFRSKLEGIYEGKIFEKIAYKQDTLYAFDSLGNIQVTVGFSSKIQDVKTVNDTIFLLSEDSIFILDTSLRIIGEANVNGYTDYSNLKVDINKVEFLSHGLIDQFILTLNHQLILMKILDIPLCIEKGTPKDFSDSHLATSINFKLSQFTTIRHLDYSRNSAQNASIQSTDIGIVEIKPTQITIAPIQWYEGVYRFEIYADVLVKNYGNHILTDCRINHFLGQSFGCGYLCYSEHFSNLDLATNETVWLSLGLIHAEENFFNTDTITSEICVYTSHPNFKTDVNVSNDEACLNVIMGYAGELEMNTNEMRLYPNPVKSSLTIQLNGVYDAQYFVYDMHGWQITHGNLVSNTIDVGTLTSGIYILQIRSINGLQNYFRHFVKD
ncbi:MAG: T9SS type A sorting domain-containing protein [Paludibacter sp.]